MKHVIQGAILGLCIGDALGVPVEFISRDALSNNPVTDLRAFGTHRQPAGTWSDDTSLTLCLLDSLKDELDYQDIMSKFLSWMEKGAYTARGDVFDVGIATRNAITRFAIGKPAHQCGCTSEYDNGNGSLMRILPALFYLKHKYGTEGILCPEGLETIHKISALTHGHTRSQMACGIYIAVAARLLVGGDIETAINSGIEDARQIYSGISDFESERRHFHRVFDPDLGLLPEQKIKSSGYVIDTLEAALWCMMNTTSYTECVLQAVNLGGDTDTVAAVAGGLAGLYYGLESIPVEWLDEIARVDFIVEICNKAEAYCQMDHSSI